MENPKPTNALQDFFQDAQPNNSPFNIPAPNNPTGQNPFQQTFNPVQ